MRNALVRGDYSSEEGMMRILIPKLHPKALTIWKDTGPHYVQQIVQDLGIWRIMIGGIDSHMTLARYFLRDGGYTQGELH